MPTPYPAPAPTISGSTISVDAFLKSPPMVQRMIDDLTLNRFVADQMFAPGPPATGGAVLYDQVTASELYTTRDVQAIEPGAAFPILNETEANPLVAAAVKYGGAIELTYEAIRRDRRDLLARGLTKLRNTVIKKVDAVALAALDAAVTAGTIPTAAASADWGTIGTDIILDIETGRSAVDEADLGYQIDTVLLNPAEALGIRKNTGIRAALPRENTANNLIGSRDLDGLLGIPHWYITNRVSAGRVYLVQSKTTGTISDEMPLYSRVVDDEKNERKLVMAARVVVPYITDPKSAYVITGA